MSSRRNRRGTRRPRCIVTSPSRSSLLVLSVPVPVCRIVQALPIHKSRPDLSLRCRAVVEAVLLCGGSIGTAGEVAPHLGLHNRFELGRLLKHEGLPALHYLAAWASVLSWLDGAESTGCSLCQLAFRARKDPATCYRTVKRITGLPWLEIRRRGSAWVVQRFIAQCRRGQDGLPKRSRV